VERAGGTAAVNRVGQAFFKTRMRDTGAAFGGEVSGHYYFRDFYNADSGTIPALLILELLSVENRKLSELLEPLRSRYFTSGEISSEVEDQEDKMEELVERYPDGEITRLDGVSVDYDDCTSKYGPLTRSRPCASISSPASRSSTWRTSGTRCSRRSGPEGQPALARASSRRTASSARATARRASRYPERLLVSAAWPRRP
jgi:hypothetical protein